MHLSDNEKNALSVIRQWRGMTRVQMAEHLGFTRMHATNVAKALLEKRLIIDEPQPVSGRGQPTRLMRLKPGSVYSVGVNFTSTEVKIAITDWVGEIKTQDRFALSSPTVEDLSDRITAYVEKNIKECRIARRGLCGVGIALPGDFVEDRKRVNTHYFPSLSSPDLTEAFSEKLQLPVVVENDSNAAAWGERVLGAGRQLSSFLFVHIGHGVGGGIVIDGKLFRGHHGNAGVFGIAFPMDQPRPSGQDLLRTLRKHGLDVEDFYDLQSLDIDQTPPLAQWIERAAEQLSRPLSLLARAIDPEAIVLGGRLPHHIVQRLVELIDNEKFCAPNRHELPVPHLLVSEMGDTAGMVGAAALCLEKIFFTGS